MSRKSALYPLCVHSIPLSVMGSLELAIGIANGGSSADVDKPCA
nr:MAG TPA: hypothetical protein [Caudoviricetes sp.]